MKEGKHDDLKTPPQNGEPESGIDVLPQEGGYKIEALPWGDPKEGTKVAWKSAGLGDKLSVQWHPRHPNDLAPVRSLSPQTIDTFPSCSCPRPGTASGGLCWERIATMQ